MQNRYVGDVGDFGKLGLLRWTTGVTGPDMPDGERLRLGVVWYLHPNEENGDGGIDTPLDLQGRDPYLYGRLGEIRAGTVEDTRQGRILPWDTTYFSPRVSPPPKLDTRFRRFARENWLGDAMEVTEGSHVVLVDPDNGIASLNARLASPKHTYLSELNHFIERGQSLVIYHSFGRGCTHEEQIQCVGRRLQSEFDGQKIWPLWYRASGTSRVFFIVAQPAHRLVLDDRLGSFVGSQWCGAEGRLFKLVDIRR